MRQNTAMDAPFLTNRKPEDRLLQSLLALSDEQEPILFAVIGEISKRARYGTLVLLGTREHLFTYDPSTDTVSERIAFSEVERLYNKRMYGNGLMRARMKDGRILDLFRFNFTVTSLCDAVVNYVNDINGGVSPEEALFARLASPEKASDSLLTNSSRMAFFSSSVASVAAFCLFSISLKRLST